MRERGDGGRVGGTASRASGLHAGEELAGGGDASGPGALGGEAVPVRGEVYPGGWGDRETKRWAGLRRRRRAPEPESEASPSPEDCQALGGGEPGV